MLTKESRRDKVDGETRCLFATGATVRKMTGPGLFSVASSMVLPDGGHICYTKAVMTVHSTLYIGCHAAHSIPERKLPV